MRSNRAEGTRGARIAVAALLAAACTSSGQLDESLPLAELPVAGTLSLHVDEPGLPVEVIVQLDVAPTAPIEVDVIGRRPADRRGDDAMVQLTVRYEDFPGQGPVSSGRTLNKVVPFGAGGIARVDAPVRSTTVVSLPEARGVVARRVTVSGRLWPVDILAASGRWGGRALDLEGATLETFARVTEAGIELGAPPDYPGDLFLAIASTPTEERDALLEELLARLPELTGAALDETFAGLLYLTGARHGRSVSRWTAWWRQRSEAR